MLCRLRVEDSKTLAVRTGTDGVGASAVRMGESFCGTALSCQSIGGIGTHKCLVFIESGW